MAHFTLEQRYSIQAFKEAGRSTQFIADHIGKDKSSVYRELNRNSDKRSNNYSPSLADRKCKDRHKNKPKNCNFTAEIEVRLLYYLSLDFSPEQIVGRCKLDGLKMVCVETIYHYIYLNKRKGGHLYNCLRTKGKKYKRRCNVNNKRGSIVGRIDIDERPPVVEEKERLGDLEIDLVIGQNHKGALLTINDRASGFLFMGKIETKEASKVVNKTLELLEDWIPILHTITSDNGKEFANHKQISEKLEINYYFAKPYHSWERGANENLNGLVRQYFPKKTNFAIITDEEIIIVVNILNNRPRKRFGYKTPNEIFAEKLDKLNNVAFIT